MKVCLEEIQVAVMYILQRYEKLKGGISCRKTTNTFIKCCQNSHTVYAGFYPNPGFSCTEMTNDN